MKNWIDLLNNFYSDSDAEPLTPKAAALYNYLLYRLNRAYWHEPIQIRLVALADATRQSLFSVKKARSELVERGYIRYESQGGSAAAKYYLTSKEDTQE